MVCQTFLIERLADMKYILLFLHLPHKYRLFRKKLLAAGLIVGFEIKIKNPNVKKYPENSTTWVIFNGHFERKISLIHEMCHQILVRKSKLAGFFGN